MSNNLKLQVKPNRLRHVLCSQYTFRLSAFQNFLQLSQKKEYNNQKINKIKKMKKTKREINTILRQCHRVTAHHKLNFNIIDGKVFLTNSGLKKCELNHCTFYIH